jgi:hypothetical protein
MGHEVQELDASDPDSDIPDELQFILAGQVDDGDGDTLSYRPPSRLLLQRSDTSLGPPMLELFVEQLRNVFRTPAKVDFRYGVEVPPLWPMPKIPGLRVDASSSQVMDDDRGSSLEDSPFEKTGRRSSVSSDSVFGYDDQAPLVPIISSRFLCSV